MTVAVAWPYNSGAFDRELRLGNALPQRLFGGAALMCVAAACAWTVCANIGPGHSDELVAARADRLAFAASRSDKLAVMRSPQLASADSDTAAFDSRFDAAFPSAALGGYTLASAEQSDAPLPLLARRLARSGAPRSAETRLRQHAPAADGSDQQTETATTAPTDTRSLFEKIFGGPSSSPSIFAKLFGSPQEKVALAYAAPEAGGTGAGVASPLYDRQTAVYDISAHVVYMPDGTTLEAHSGIGDMLDDPHYVNAKDRGPTPPDVYELKPREALFHGVHALRLIPVDETKVYGRSGLLAHTYMLGPNGQSNGCVSFKDYDAFLQAYENHEITRLAVVSHVD
jgi:hypothetical protein